MPDKITELLDRAKKAGLKVEKYEHEHNGSTTTQIYILIPSGRNSRSLPVGPPERAEMLSKIDFENITFLHEYDAIANLKTGEIEAIIMPREPLGYGHIDRRLGFNTPAMMNGDEDTEGTEGKALTTTGPDDIRLEISYISNDLRILLASPTRIRFLSIKIRTRQKISHDDAIILLERIANSLFFQIELEKDVALALRKHFRPNRRPRKYPTQHPDSSKIQFPKFEYDEAPISLYWYGRSANEMPLLQFLAYYQVAEYYFPNFSKNDAITKARKILKNPTFRIDRDADLSRLLNSISGISRSGTSEREQLKITIYEVLTPDEITKFFDDNADVAEAVGRKNKLITEKTINTKRRENDLRAEISDMLYDIRCRIVHTKNEGPASKADMLVPFSPAEEGLWPYIELMRFIAQNTLIRASFPLHL